MKQKIVLSICGRQSYMGQDPDVIELVTEGTLEKRSDDSWELSYEESELTGMAGVTTTFHIEDQKITLIRSGRLNSRMVFQEGVSHDSLYQMDFGALMLTVCANRIMAQISYQGGMIDLVYQIDIEQTSAGTIDYHMEFSPKYE